MKRDPLVVLFILVCLLCLVATSAVSAAEFIDVSAIRGWDHIIVIFSTTLALVLGIISFVGYRRDGRTKVLLVTLAFMIFTIKGVFIVSGDLFGKRVDPFFDIVENLLDFGILACLFFGMTMK
ncbi:MAG: hypothetical protein WC294_05365 [Methanoregula sp.]|jgi:hypothetical protein